MSRVKIRKMKSSTRLTKRTSKTNIHKNKRIKLKKYGGVDMINVIEKANSQIMYSTSHAQNREVNEKNIRNIFKKYSKSMKKLAE